MKHFLVAIVIFLTSQNPALAGHAGFESVITGRAPASAKTKKYGCYSYPAKTTKKEFQAEVSRRCDRSEKPVYGGSKYDKDFEPSFCCRTN